MMKLRFVVFEEEGKKVAVCLEKFIAAQAPDMLTLWERLRTVYEAELADQDNFRKIVHAPDMYQEMWDNPRGSTLRGCIRMAPDIEVGIT